MMNSHHLEIFNGMKIGDLGTQWKASIRNRRAKMAVLFLKVAPWLQSILNSR
jgi:hypothetical protein